MKYEIIYDKEKIKALRYDQRFAIYDCFYDTKSNEEITIDELQDYIVENQEVKNKRRFIAINPFKNGYKQKKYALLPHTVMLDIDIKGKNEEAIKERLKTDMGESSYTIAFKKLFDTLRKDPTVFYIDFSHSGKGIKCLINILSDYYIKNFANYVPAKDSNGIVPSTLMKENFHQVLQYLNDKYGITFDNNESDNYIDNASGKVTQGLFSSWGKGLSINPDAAILMYKFSKPIITPTKATISNSQLKAENDEFCEKFFPKVKQLYQDSFSNDEAKERYLDFVDKLSAKIDHYINALPLLFSLKHTATKYQQQFYIFFRKLYVGNSIKVERFDDFQAQLLKLKGQYGIPLSRLFNFLSVAESEEDKDLFKNKFDDILSYRDYVDERKGELFRIFDSKNKVVINADAGGGKTTLLSQYAYENIKSGKYKKVVIVIPKNFLLEQQHQILSKKYPDVNIHRNFARYRYTGGNGIILSSTPSLHRIKDPDLLLIDEVQNLAKFSNEIISNVFWLFSNTKTIMYSATPEPYLINEEDYYYVRLNRENKGKHTLYKFISKQHNRILKQLINPQKKQLIFFNNIRESQKIFSKENFGIDFIFLNSDNNKNADNQQVVIQQELIHSHYVATSVISDGINFKNGHWDDLIIVENGSLGPDEIYQLSNRFRNAQSLNVYLISKPRPATLNCELQFHQFNDIDAFKKKVKASLILEKELNKETDRNLNKSLLKNDHFIKDADRYIFNIDSLKRDIYVNKFLIPYMHYQDVIEYALNYYFNVIQIFRIEAEKIPLGSHSKEIELFQVYADSIVDILEDSSFNDYEILHQHLEIKISFDDHTWGFLKKNERTFRTFTTRYLEIKELDGDVDKAILNNNQYNKFIKGLKKKKLGMTTDDKELDSFDKRYWDRQNQFKTIIEENILKKHHTTKGEYSYTTVDDVLELFSGKVKLELNPGKELYNKFHNENGESDFKLSCESIGKYMSGISRFFTKKRVHFNGGRLIIYSLVA